MSLRRRSGDRTAWRVNANASPRGPQLDDEAHDRLFSEIGPPETVVVNESRVVLFDHKGDPLTRKIGFR